MKGKIDRDGSLYLERAGKLKGQFCPHQKGLMNCGDWCPHFGEPEIEYSDDYEEDVYLHLTCGQGRVFAFDEFTDERGTK
jgi:hypothetical protein